MSAPREIVNFAAPPLVEVVCGVQFEELDSLKVSHFGLLWQEFIDEFPTTQDNPPLPHLIESTPSEKQPESIVTAEVSAIPAVPRVWFVHRDDREVIQVQRDRFLHNWRRTQAGLNYPRFANIIGQFKDNLSRFESFIAENALCELRVNKLELTYINHIDLDRADTLASCGLEVFPDHAWRVNQERFLPSPESIRVGTTFQMPSNSGRLHVTARNAIRQSDASPLVLLDLTARGMPEDGDIWGWFDLAHEWVVRGFVDITNPTLQVQKWGLVK